MCNDDPYNDWWIFQGHKHIFLVLIMIIIIITFNNDRELYSVAMYPFYSAGQTQKHSAV